MAKCLSNTRRDLWKVQVNYDGYTEKTSSNVPASSIIHTLSKDRVGAQIEIHFYQQDAIDWFYETLKEFKEFRSIPSALYRSTENIALYGENIESIKCRAINSNKPIQIVKMKPCYTEVNGESLETVIIYARRITPEEVLKYLDDDVIIFNEATDDIYKIRRLKGYAERFKSCSKKIKKLLVDDIETKNGTENSQIGQPDFNALASDGEKLWVETPGVGWYNRDTGEIFENG